MSLVVLSQRLDWIPSRNETRESVDLNLIRFFSDCDLDVVIQNVGQVSATFIS